jgi:NTP pyrophosphatase (non-canonical NTP hydrolase)
MALNTENFFEEWRQKKLPEEWQKKTDGFANAPIDNSVEQSIFRAGFFIGINLEEIKKEYGIEDEGVKSKKFFFKKKAHMAVERRKNKVIPASWAVEQQKNRGYKMSLEINEYQKKAHETACYMGMENGDFRYPVMGLAEEAGEVSGKFAKAVRDANGIIDGDRREEIKKELGDVCWFVAEISTLLSLDLEEVMQGNLDKLASRAARGVIHGSGDNR